MEDLQSLIAQLMDDYGDYLKKTAYIMVNDIELAEDLVQETFFAFYKSFTSFRGESSYKTYLYRILMNQVKMHYRKKKLPITQTNTEIDAAIISFEDATVRTLDLHHAIQKLHFKYAQIIVLYYFEDMTIEVIAATLDLSTSAVKMRLKRGRTKLSILVKGEHTHGQLETSNE